MRYFKIILFLIILFPFSVNAALCSNADRVRLQKLAQNITTSYDYVEENGNVTFTLTFNNLNSELYLIDIKNNRRFDYSGEELVLGGFLPDTSYKFGIRATNMYCDSSVLYYVYVNTPAYNPYYNDPICSGLDYKYCSKWQKNTFSYEDFIKNVEAYKQSLIIKPSDLLEDKGIFDYIIDFYSNYYYIILPIIIIFSLIYIITQRKKNDLF